MSKTIQSTVGFQGPDTVVVASGVLTLDLSVPSEITSGGGQVAPKRYTITLDANGKIPANTSILANDELTPAGTTYRAQLFDSSGLVRIADFGQWSISGASPIDLSAMTPTNAGAAYPGAFLLGSNNTATGNNTFSGTTNVISTMTFSSHSIQDSAGGSGLTISNPNANAGTGIAITAGSAVSGAHGGGSVSITAGNGSGSPAGNGGGITLTGGNATSSSTPGSITLSPGTGGAGGATIVLNGTPSGSGIPTTTLKKGTGGGNYTSASTTYVRVDSTNLAYTVTIPTGWKLLIHASGGILTATSAVTCNVAIADGGADNTGILQEVSAKSTDTTSSVPFSLSWVVTGDGASHTINLQYKTSNGSDSVTIGNNSSTFLPTMTFLLTPSN